MITFLLNGRLQLIEVPLTDAGHPNSIPKSLIISRLRYPYKQYSPYEINAAGVVLSKFPSAKDIELEFVSGGEDKKQPDTGIMGLIFIGVILSLIFAPIIILLGMHQKFLLKGVYKKSYKHPKFLKLRKLYTIFGFTYFGLGLVAFIVFIIIGDPLVPTIPLYILVAGNLIGFIVTVIISRKLAKTMPKEKPKTNEKRTSNVVIPPSNSQPSQDVTKTVDTSKNLELSNLLLKYKELYDKQIISAEEYEKLKSTTIASMVSNEQTTPIENSPVPLEEDNENTQENASFKENKNEETISSIDEYFEKYAKEHPYGNSNKQVVITATPKKSSVAYSSSSVNTPVITEPIVEEKTEIVKNENHESNVQPNKRYVIEMSVTKLSPQDRLAASKNKKTLKTLGVVSFAFMFVALAIVLVSFIFMFVPTIYYYYDINTNQYCKLSLVPIQADASIRVVFIIITLVLSASLFVLRLIKKFEKLSVLLEALFALFSIVYLILVWTSLTSAYGNEIVAWVDFVSAIVVGIFYLVLLPIRLVMKSKIKQFIKR